MILMAHSGPPAVPGKNAFIVRRREHILRCLRVANLNGRVWLTTRQVANETPWSVLTVIADLRVLEATGLVESRRLYEGLSARHVEWRVAG